MAKSWVGAKGRTAGGLPPPSVPAKAPGKANALWSRLATGAGRTVTGLQRSPLSDSVKDAFNNAKSQPFEALLARLSQSDVQADQADVDVDNEIASLLAKRADDLWVAQRIRQGKLGDTTGQFGPKVKGKPVARPINAFFFQGTSAQRALVIAGVHGSERQGIEVAQLLIKDLQSTSPFLTTIVVPSLFPDNAAAKHRETETGTSDIPTNRNFPEPNEDLAAATKAGKGTAVDASKEGGQRTRAILPENVLLLQLLERFKPERIISIHGTRRAGAGGIFFDPRSLTAAEERDARFWAGGMAYMSVPPDQQVTPEGQDLLKQNEEKFFQQRLAFLRHQADKKDESLSSNAATQVDSATKGLAEREKRSFGNREDDPKKVSAAEVKARKAHPSIAGNVGKSGNIDRFSWSGGTPNGVSLGGYAPKRGMSVFTVEPPINANTADYAAKGFTLDKVSAADRLTELQSYADAVRTVLLGK